jgi:site-specific DNA-methyltransferase (cytosine-N4-specific)
LLRKPLDEIIDEIGHPDTHIRGLALEALAFKLMRLIDLKYVATRLRGAQTRGTEVDLIFDSTRLVFTRWQIQCKNTAQVRLDDVAKEVGLTHMLKSNAIVMVSTGTIGPEARRYAQTVMKNSNLAIILIDREDIDMVSETPPTIIDILRREAKNAMRPKKLELK